MTLTGMEGMEGMKGMASEDERMRSVPWLRVAGGRPSLSLQVEVEATGVAGGE